MSETPASYNLPPRSIEERLSALEQRVDATEQSQAQVSADIRELKEIAVLHQRALRLAQENFDRIWQELRAWNN